jgi:hypothetical protein
MLTTPFCCVLTSVTIEHSEKALTVYLRKGGYKGMRIFHETSWALRVSNTTSKSDIFRDVRIRYLWRKKSAI